MKKLARWILYLLGGIAALAGLMVVIGLFVSPDVEAAVSIDIASPPERVWEMVAEMENLPRWSSEISSAEQIGENPKRYRVSGAGGDAEYEIISAEPPRRLVARMTSSSFNVTGNWDLAIEPAGQGSRIRVRMKMNIGNPLFRFFSLFMDVGEQERKTLESLKAYLEKGT
ncbi:MAG: hypothetical protein FJW20_02740 [Acidimicrobiia bacterium]|nr:hypothetical protein [Acidimicrobiia bacterium]